MILAGRIAAAIELLGQIQSAGRRPADAVANEYFRSRRFIGSGDRKAISSMVWEVIRHFRRLHYWLKIPEGESASPRLLAAALLLLEQGAGSGGKPAWSSLKEIFSGIRHAPAPLTDRERLQLSVLERIPDSLMPDNIALEYPVWLDSRLERVFGPEKCSEMQAMLEHPPLDLRVNLLKTTREEVLRALKKEEGVKPQISSLSPWGIRLPSRQFITASPLFREGAIEIQDEGSQIIVLLAAPKPGDRVLDYCAGAGGKTLALAMQMENRGSVIACDISAVRLNSSVRRLRRAGIHNVSRHLLGSDPKWRKRRAGDFDVVLADAPCSGTGTWRRNPDARQKFRLQDLEELQLKQQAILREVSSLVKPGGRLVYATCSILQEENRDQITAFLANHPEYRISSKEKLAGAVPKNILDEMPEEAILSLTPRRHGTDGFFACVLERRDREGDFPSAGTENGPE